jgi:hypothetical protein
VYDWKYCHGKYLKVLAHEFGECSNVFIRMMFALGRRKEETMPKKSKKDKSSDVTITIPILHGLDFVFVKLRIITGKDGKLKRTKMDWPNGDWMWTTFNKKGKPTSCNGGGKGWDMDTTVEYDKKGRKKSSKTTTRRGRVVTETTRKFDPKTGKVIGGKSRTYLEGPF